MTERKKPRGIYTSISRIAPGLIGICWGGVVLWTVQRCAAMAEIRLSCGELLFGAPELASAPAIQLLGVLFGAWWALKGNGRGAVVLSVAQAGLTVYALYILSSPVTKAFFDFRLAMVFVTAREVGRAAVFGGCSYVGALLVRWYRCRANRSR